MPVFDISANPGVTAGSWCPQLRQDADELKAVTAKSGNDQQMKKCLLVKDCGSSICVAQQKQVAWRYFDYSLGVLSGAHKQDVKFHHAGREWHNQTQQPDTEA